MNEEKCPFRVGEIVTYRPSSRGRRLVVMTHLAALKPGAKYKIARIDNGLYVTPEGFENDSGGGLYWSEFTKE